MLLTNHTLTGVALGLLTGHPAVALPVGVLSHLFQDMLPHYGPDRRSDADKNRRAPHQLDHNYSYRDKYFLIVGSIDFCLSLSIAVTAAYHWPAAAWSIGAGVLGATLPDLTYIPVVVFSRPRIERWFPWYRQMLLFLGRIQRWERPWGITVELAWAAALIWWLSGWWPLMLH